MPRTRQKSSFPIVTSVTVTISLVGMGLMALKPSIPPPNPNRLIANQETYLEAGTLQEVDWQPLSANAFRMAAREEKPIFLVIGDSASRSARQADRLAFSDPDVVEQLRREFICIRIDRQQFPAMASAYMPLRRIDLRADASLQIWFLDSSGKIYHSGLVTSANQDVDAFWLTSVLRNSRELYARAIGNDPAVLPPGESQKQDRAELVEQPASEPNFQAHYDALMAVANSRSGGFPEPQNPNLERTASRQMLLPSVWRFLQLVGDLASLKATLDPVLASPIVDWLDGGFFHLANTSEWRDIEFDKFAAESAEMMSLLAELSVLHKNGFYREIAVRAFDDLFNNFRDGAFIRTARIGEEDELRRGLRNSFSVRVLRESGLSLDERHWLRENFGLRVEVNPQMSIAIANPQLLERSRELFQRYLNRLRRIRSRVVPKYSGDQQLDSGGTAIARMIETSRILGDQERQGMAVQLAEKLVAFRSGAVDVDHSLRIGGRATRYLGDYMAYADATLQQFLATGQITALFDGYTVLRRALSAYTGSGSGVFFDSIWDMGAPKPPDIPSPDVVDDLGEATVSKLIRLCFDYGRVFRVLEEPVSDLVQPGFENHEAVTLAARNAVSRFAGPLAGKGVMVSSFFCSALRVQDDAFAFTVGEQCIEQANKLAATVPGVLVMPACALRSKEYRDLKPGTYVSLKGNLNGPVGLDEAARLLKSNN